MAALFMCYGVPRNSFFIHLQLSRANPLVVSHSMPQLLQLISSRRWSALKPKRKDDSTKKTFKKKKVINAKQTFY